MKEETEKMLIDAIINLGTGMEKLQKEMKAMHEQQIKTNLAIIELRTSVIKLDDRLSKLENSFNKLDDSFNKYARRNDVRADDHETRITRLEKHLPIASEPPAVYKRKKKKK